MPRVILYGSSGILAQTSQVVATKRIFLIVLFKAKMAKIRLEMAIKCLKVVEMVCNIDMKCIMILINS